MKPSLEQKLIKKYPKLFKQTFLPETESCMYWGIAVEDGWYDIIAELCKELSQFPEVEFAQIKNKFGLLRVYIDNPNPEADLLIQEAEMKSQYTCEICGDPGKQEGWRVRCEKCTGEKI